VTFINPLDVLGVDAADAADVAAIRKARRRVLVELELAGDSLEICGEKYPRSDLVRALGELDDPEQLQGYQALRRAPELASFLRTGNPAFFLNGVRHDSGDSALLRVVSPHYARRLGETLAAALRDGNADLIRALTRCRPLVLPADSALADRPVDAVLRRIRSELTELSNGVKEEHVAAEDALAQIRLLVHPDALNALPPSYAAARSNIARQLRNLAVVAYNVQDATKVSYTLLTDASRVHASPDIAEDVRKQLAVIREVRDRLVAQQHHAHEIAQCARIMAALFALVEKVDTGITAASDAADQALRIANRALLNGLPPALADSRGQVAATLRSLAVSIWNEFNDASAAMKVLDHALALSIPEDLKEQLRSDAKQLTELSAEQQQRRSHELAFLQMLRGTIQSMTAAVQQHDPSNVRWGKVADSLLELFPLPAVTGLAELRNYEHQQIRQLLVALVPLLRALFRNHRSGHDVVVRRLQVIAAGALDLQRILDSTESGTPIWESSWFWGAIVIGAFMLLSLCS
jgi:hypothetical protein